MSDKSLKKVIAETRERYTLANEAPIRVNRGYKLREDLIKACKRVALEQNRTLYEVMEQALEEYLDRQA